MFPQLGVIPGIWSIEIVAVVERYVVLSRVKNKEPKEAAVPNMPSCNNLL